MIFTFILKMSVSATHAAATIYSIFYNYWGKKFLNSQNKCYELIH